MEGHIVWEFRFGRTIVSRLSLRYIKRMFSVSIVESKLKFKQHILYHTPTSPRIPLLTNPRTRDVRGNIYSFVKLCVFKTNRYKKTINFVSKR